MADERMDTMALEEVQNRLHASLIKSAAANPLLRAGDWGQGGWSRASAQSLTPDKIEYGYTKKEISPEQLTCVEKRTADFARASVLSRLLLRSRHRRKRRVALLYDGARAVAMIRNVIVKVTLGCNIDCRYCYVQRNRDVVRDQIMSPATLEALVRNVGEYLHRSPLNAEEFVFYWHGGEPLLAGIPFFERAMRLQRQYLPNNTSVINTIQTNGLLLNSEWARLIKAHNIGLCLSLDGPPEINDQWRRTKSGRGTHHLVLRGIEVLRREDIPLSILSVITPEALPHGVSIYGALRELGGGWMDFMYPFYSRIDNTLDESIEPERWGHFLVDVFDAWMAEGNPDVEIRMLHDICMSILRGRTKMCISCADCSYVLTINPNGDAYICDDLLAYADSWLGNIHEAGIDEVVKEPQVHAAGRQERAVRYGVPSL